MIVAPIGIVNDLVVFPTPNSSIISKLTGTDALLEAVENVTAATCANLLKKGLTLSLVNILNNPP